MKELVRGTFHLRALIDFTWAMPQTLLGLLYSIASLLAGASAHGIPGHCCIISNNPLMPSYTGVSLGPFLLGGPGFNSWPHEYGHTYQSRILGPLYLIVIGIPSLLSASLRPGKHGQLYTERWANSMLPEGSLAHQMESLARKTGQPSKTV